ncbi:MAG: L,D-transpeptidase, partial [Actinobacteria bacterium]|nr:L,D-transpeptidase [Actinomycetota bacterium]
GRTYYYKVSLVGRDGLEIGATDIASGVLPPKRRDSGGIAGKRIIISIYDQRIYFLEDEVLVKSHLCSTGIDSHPTPGGVFKVDYHEYCLVSEMYGDVLCYWWMGFAPDIGMHALPYDPKSGTWTGGGSLGHKASHGCVRQAVKDAEWAYKWAPNGTRIDVIGHHYEPPAPPPPGPPPITGGHASQGVSQAQKEWYLAEGCTTNGFDEYMLMMNPNPGTASVATDYMKPDGSVINVTYSVPGFSRYTVRINDIPGLEDTEVSVRMLSDQPIVAERSMYFEYRGKLGGSDTVGASATSKTWYLAEGYTGGDFDEFILIQNPQTVDSKVRTEYMRSDGQNVMKEYDVKAHSRFSIHVDDIPELASAEVSTKITSEQPVVVERAQYFNYYGRDDGNASTAISEPSQTWYLAEGYTGGQFDEYVLLQNPGENAGFARVTFMRSDGKNFQEDYTLKPKSRFTIHVDDIPELSNAEVSTYVESDVGIIVERSMYFVSNGRPGGSDAPGVTGSAKYWYLAEGYTGGDFDTYVLIMNPNNEKVTVDVNYLLPEGRIVPAGYTVEPYSRYTVHVDTVPGMSSTEFSTALTGSKPIICERAMYFSVPRSNNGK